MPHLQRFEWHAGIRTGRQQLASLRQAGPLRGFGAGCVQKQQRLQLAAGGRRQAKGGSKTVHVSRPLCRNATKGGKASGVVQAWRQLHVRCGVPGSRLNGYTANSPIAIPETSQPASAHLRLEAGRVAPAPCAPGQPRQGRRPGTALPPHPAERTGSGLLSQNVFQPTNENGTIGGSQHGIANRSKHTWMSHQRSVRLMQRPVVSPHTASFMRLRHRCNRNSCSNLHLPFQSAHGLPTKYPPAGMRRGRACPAPAVPASLPETGDPGRRRLQRAAAPRTRAPSPHRKRT